jgi:hypothetical protein
VPLAQLLDDLFGGVSLAFHGESSAALTRRQSLIPPGSTFGEQAAVSTPNAGFQDERYRGLFTEDEFRATFDDVRQKLIPQLDDEISNWRWNFRSEDAPDSHFDELVSALKEYRETFADDAEATKLIDDGLGSIERIVEELPSEQPHTLVLGHRVVFPIT